MLILGMPMNGVIGYLMASMVLQEPHLGDSSWLWSPAFLAGSLLAVAGMVLTRQSDRILRSLRSAGGSGYQIPHGGLYRWVSCPNYLGEILQWAGFALAAGALPAIAFALYTTSNLLPRALASHRWYREQFPDYPAQRRALLPGLL